MLFAHFVVNGEEFFVFNLFDSNAVVFIDFFSLKGRKSNAAAAYDSFSCCMNNVAAKWADIKL